MAIVRTYKIGNTTIIDRDDSIESEERAREHMRNIGRIVMAETAAAKLRAQLKAEEEAPHA